MYELANFFQPSQLLFSKADREYFANTDIREHKDKYEFIFDIPGVDEKNLEIKVKNNSLTVSGFREGNSEAEANNYKLIERKYGKFNRKFKFPVEIDVEQTEAIYNNGVLKVITPKSASEQERKVSIKS